MKTSASFYFALIAFVSTFQNHAADSIGLRDAVRANDRAKVELLIKQGADLEARDEIGNTPLITAAFYADAGIIEDLLKAGANINAANKPGATALMRAAAFPEKAKLLILHNADVKARSALGNDALILAARNRNSLATLKMLLDRGVDVNGTNVFGATPLMTAVASGDLAAVNLLLDRGAKIDARPNMDTDGFILGGGRTPLMCAAYQGNEEMIKLLLKRGARVNESAVIGSALTQAAWSGQLNAARLLLDAGAHVNQRDLIANYTPLHWAASSENSNPALVELLLAHGADANAEGGQPVDNFLGAVETPLSLARKRGDTPIVRALLKAGAKEDSSTAASEKRSTGLRLAGAKTIQEAVERALPPLIKTAETSAGTFEKHASKQACISCHQQQLPLAAMSMATRRGFAVDAQIRHHQLELLNRMIGRFLEPAFETTFLPETTIFAGYAVLDLKLENVPGSLATDSLAHEVAISQFADGHWARNMPRPPIQASDISATALGIYVLKSYPISNRQAEFAKRIERARNWLAKAHAETTEERAHQILGLAWAGETPAGLKRIANELIAQQRSDKGWGSLPGLESDAFATGQTMYALREGAKIPVSHPAIHGGIEFLLRTQAADGTWHVRRRTHPFQPPMESSFPYGADGWISAAGSSWAVMGLVSSMDADGGKTLIAPIAANSSRDEIVKTAAVSTSVASASAPVDFARDIQPILERSCVACHSGERPKGGLKLSDRASLLHGGNRREPVVVAGDSSQSAIVRLVSDQVEDLEMPPLSQRKKFPGLTADEIARLNAWVDQGAVWPENVVLKRSN